MAFELREGQGTLFREKDKKSEKSPDMKGEALIGGVLHEIAGWTKEGKNGKFLSLSIKPKGGNTAHGKAKANGYSTEGDDDVPPF